MSVVSSNDSFYTYGDIIVQNPVESTVVFLIVVTVCATLEYIFTLADEVQNKFFGKIFDTVSEEILIVGLLSLLVTFGSSVIPLTDSWNMMFQWTHVCLLHIGIFFVLTLLLILLLVVTQNASFRKFEASRINLSTFDLAGRERLYKLAFLNFRSSCSAFGIHDELQYAEYLLHFERRNVIKLGNLTWKSWLALSIVIVINALRTRAPALVPALQSNQDTINVASYIGVVGYGTLGMFLSFHLTLQRRLRLYLDKQAAADVRKFGGLQDSSSAAAKPLLSIAELDDPQAFLLWQTLDSTIAILQIVFLFFVWYMAIFSLNMLYITFSLPNVYLTIIFVAAALLPLVLFFILVPWTLTMVACLSSSGTCVNRPLVSKLTADYESLKAENGVHRQKKLRVRELLEQRERKKQKKSAFGLLLEAEGKKVKLSDALELLGD